MNLPPKNVLAKLADTKKMKAKCIGIFEIEQKITPLDMKSVKSPTDILSTNKHFTYRKAKLMKYLFYLLSKASQSEAEYN